MTLTENNNRASPLEKLFEYLLSWFRYLGIAFIMAIMLIMVAHAFGRYFLRQPIPGAVELTSLLLAGGSFLLFGYIMLQDGHISVNHLIRNLPVRTQAVIGTSGYLLCLVLSLVAMWRTFIEAIDKMECGQVTTVLGIPPFPFIFLVGLGWGLLVIAIIIRLVHFIIIAINGE